MEVTCKLRINKYLHQKYYNKYNTLVTLSVIRPTVQPKRYRNILKQLKQNTKTHSIILIQPFYF